MDIDRRKFFQVTAAVAAAGASAAKDIADFEALAATEIKSVVPLAPVVAEMAIKVLPSVNCGEGPMTTSISFIPTEILEIYEQAYKEAGKGNI
jgi:hypothetical protein